MFYCVASEEVWFIFTITPVIAAEAVAVVISTEVGFALRTFPTFPFAEFFTGSGVVGFYTVSGRDKFTVTVVAVFAVTGHCIVPHPFTFGV